MTGSQGEAGGSPPAMASGVLEVMSGRLELIAHRPNAWNAYPFAGAKLA